MNAFLATVKKVFLDESEFLKLNVDSDYVKFYNNNKNFANNDARFLGAIEFARTNSYKLENYAFPFDKNNITFPIEGETVFILVNDREYYWMPYTNTQYPNYREDYKTSEASKDRNISKISSDSKTKDYKENKQTGTPNIKSTEFESKKSEYGKNEKIKFLKPNQGDTILSGRVGNTIRFSEFHLTEDGKTSSPAIFIRNKQNSELDSKPIGTLVDEDINKDGTSVYITSNKVKVPFTETVSKEKIAFKNYPNSKNLSGDQLFVNSDRIILSSKASEFIIFGKGNTGVITDGNYSVDAEKEIYLHSSTKITIHSKGNNQIFLDSENGKIYLGKNKGEGNDGADVQKMVLGGELVAILKELIDAINQQQYLTPSGASGLGPINISTFNSIKGKLNNILSSTNFLSK